MLPLPKFPQLFAPATPPQTNRKSPTGDASPGDNITASSIAARGGVTALLDHIKSLHFYADQIVHMHTQPARPAAFSSLRNPLPPILQSAVTAVAPRLYRHQAIAIDALLDGHHVAIATSTASGMTPFLGYC